MLNKSFARVAIVAILAMTLVVAPVSKEAQAQSASGATAFTIAFPSVVVLHYWSTLNMTLSTADLTDFLIGNTTGDDNEGTKGSVTISESSGNLEANADITSTTVNGITAVTLHIQNAWAVRAVGTAAKPNVTMSFTASSASLSGPGSNSIAASNYFVGTGGGVPSAATVTFPAPGLATPEVGDVAFDMNLTGATESGSYAGSWTLQAEIT
jgi:hypothetical protein